MPGVRVLYGSRDRYELQDPAIYEIESIFGIKWTEKVWDGTVQPPHVSANTGLGKELSEIVGSDKVSLDASTRLKHSFGMSSPEILDIRNGKFPVIVDAVVTPDDEDIIPLLAFLESRKIRGVVYGGGTSVNGSLQSQKDGVTVSISTERLRKLQISENYAVLGSGWKGLELENELNSSGYTLGHFPESMEGSTLGGWIATKAAGQESNYYGSIEDRLLAVRILRSDGVLADTISPRESAGLMAKDIAAGSEGKFGIITEAAVRLDRLPLKRYYRSFIVESFEAGIAYLRNMKAIPAISRLSDGVETEFSLLNSRNSLGLKYVRRIVRMKKFSNPSILIMVDNDQDRITKPSGSFSIGSSPAKIWEKDRYERPYLGNELWMHGIVPDTLETSARWENLAELYRSTVSLFKTLQSERKFQGFIMSHISHVYPQGACIYFTFAIKSNKEPDDLIAIRDAMLANFIRIGSPVTHHHGPGNLMRKFVEGSKLHMQSLLRDPVFSEV
ncbi:MAG: FAD-binding oxidoreductase [Thermoplasmataceae archaeon]